MTRERVRQIESNALAKLRARLPADALRELLNDDRARTTPVPLGPDSEADPGSIA